jgi:iron complex transport system ATP-binding protein
MELSLDGLTVRLGDRPVLDRVSAALRPGRVTAVLGPNGAGKSTLLRAAAGLIAPAAGAVRLDGSDVRSLGAQERALALGYLPQDGTAHWNLLARELVALGRLPHRATPAENAAAIDRALALTDAEAFADRPVLTLSGGERVRILLARVLAGAPRWLLADEPLASLDPAHAIDMVARLREAAAAGAGVLLVVHDLVHAQRAADDALLLIDGRVLAAGAASEVLTPDHLARAFGVRVAAVQEGARILWVPVGRA